MLDLFFDPVGGGFFDTQNSSNKTAFGVLGTRRKPFQDSPTPAGNPVAAIALLRLYAYTNDDNYREKAGQTLDIFGGVAGQYGLFAATYGIAGIHFSQPHTQVVVIGSGELADQLYIRAAASFSLSKAVLQLDFNKAVPQNLPPALAQTIPDLPTIKERKTAAIICSGFTCQAPIFDPDQLATRLQPSVAVTQ
jgi:uncharacterized protein YyaL (SSP411 family)